MRVYVHKHYMLISKLIYFERAYTSKITPECNGKFLIYTNPLKFWDVWNLILRIHFANCASENTISLLALIQTQSRFQFDFQKYRNFRRWTVSSEIFALLIYFTKVYIRKTGRKYMKHFLYYKRRVWAACIWRILMSLHFIIQSIIFHHII